MHRVQWVKVQALDAGFPLKNDYRSIADALSRDIQSGRLRPGERLPPQRTFAYERGIAASTAERIYRELGRRGLVVGEVGRGTFVRDSHAPPGSTLIDLPPTPVNLELVSPVLEAHLPLFAASLAQLAGGAAFRDVLGPVGAFPAPGMQDIAARFLARPDWAPSARQILFTGNGKQAIGAALSAIAAPGSRVAVEALTYPVIKAVAARLGIELVPIPMDSAGISAEALDKVLRHSRPVGVYVQPSLHSPTGATIPVDRRREIAEVLKRHDVLAIEDGVYQFLVDEQPLAAFAPQHTIFVDSLSKRLAPGLALGVIAAPGHLTDQVTAAIRRGAWMPGGLALALGVRWMIEPALTRIVADKRADARSRQQVAREALKRFDLDGDERAYHLWMPLPEHWRAEAFAAAALRRGIAVTPGSAFAVGPGHMPRAVRLALTTPAMKDLQRALQGLAALAATSEEPVTE